jgi:SAM-dependent methyltransferase
LDSARRWFESEERLGQSLDFPLEDLKELLILDAGCGMGRFAEVAAKYGGIVVTADLSYAVDVAARNLTPWQDTVHCLQADVRASPFGESTFDLIYSLGVLHHTPDPRNAFLSLVPLLKPGGKITVTLYSGYNKVYVTSTNFWRRLTTRLPRRLVYYLAQWAIPAHYLYRIPLIGLLGRLIFPISHHRDREWRVLDTFDCYTPTYQSYHTHPEVFGWFKDAGLNDIAVLEPGISFIGTKPGGS